MLIIVLIASLISLINGHCDTEEKLMVKHYYELGCKPVTDVNGQIQRFDCPDFLSLDKSKCHHHGKVYDEHATIEKEYIGFCEGACFCGGYNTLDNIPAHFYCMRHYCEEYDKSYIDRRCINQHSSVKACCAENIICENEKLKDLHQCSFNNETYYEGQFMFPSNECGRYRCICDKKFDESIDPAQNPKCVFDEKCDLELRDLDRYQLGCAPVYFGLRPTCPGGQYRCPTENDRVISQPEQPTSLCACGQHSVDESNENICKFGHLTFRKGDRLDDFCYNCTCIIPPMLYCRQSIQNFC